MDLVRLTIRVPEDLHEKIRWLSYKQKRSIQRILLEALQETVKDVKLPEEAKK